MKNRIEKRENGYILIVEDGREFECSRWFEKKVEKWHVVVPKEAREICGRTYIRESYFDNSDIYEFETKTEHREGIGNGGWKNRLTEEELDEYNSLEQRMEELKKLALSRPIKELTEEEKLEREIMRLTKKLNEKRGIQG